jgi:hypothetical protein
LGIYLDEEAFNERGERGGVEKANWYEIRSQ